MHGERRARRVLAVVQALPDSLTKARLPRAECGFLPSLPPALAALYLPTLNADIIDNGVAKGDTTYILQVGAVMLADAEEVDAYRVGELGLGDDVAKDLREIGRAHV